MTTGTSKPAFGGIDILRFCAALAVALYHYYFFVWAFPQGIAGRVAEVPPQLAFGNLFSWGWIGVEVFFVISGFVIAFSAENATPGQFAVARLRRLVPAVMICAPITAVVLFFLDVYSAKSSLALTVRTVAFFPVKPWVDSVYWTLGIEIVFYSVIWALLLIGKIRWLESSAIVIGLLSTLFWLLFFPLGLDHLAATRWLDLLLVHHGCFFAFGVLLWSMRTKGVNRLRLTLAIIFTLASLLQIVAAANTLSGKVDSPIPISAPIFAYLIAIAFVSASVWVRFSWSGWRKIGLATYPLYLIHNAVGAVLIKKLQDVGIPYGPSALSALLLVIVFSCLVAWYLEPRLRSWLDQSALILRRQV